MATVYSAQEPLATYPPIDATAQIVWRFNEASGGAYANSALAVPANTGLTLGAGVARQGYAGLWGVCADVDGGSFWKTPNASIQPNVLTVSAFVRPRAFTGVFNNVICAIQSGTTSSYTWALASNTTGGGWIVRVRTGAGPTTTDVTISSSLDVLVLGQWSHIGFTYDGANIVVYKDGKQVGTAAATGTVFYNGANSFLVMGGDGSGEDFNGLISDGRVYNVAKTAAWFSETAQRGLSRI